MFEFGILALVGVVLFIAVGIFSSEIDSALGAGITFVIGLATLQFGFGVSITSILSANPLFIILFIAGYVAIGALFVYVWRFPEFIREHADEINHDFSSWSRKQPEGTDASFVNFLDSSAYNYRASDNKSAIAIWMGMWPFSATWEISRKPAIWIWTKTYNMCGAMFEKAGRQAAMKLYNGKK